MTTGDGYGSRVGVDPLDHDGSDRRRGALRADGCADRPAGDRVEDRTAASAFAELRDRSEPADPDAVLEGSPESLVENAEQSVDEPADRDDDLLDEDALEELLLSGRTEADGFRWIETPDSGDGSAASGAGSGSGAESVDAEPSGGESTDGRFADAESVGDEDDDASADAENDDAVDGETGDSGDDRAGDRTPAELDGATAGREPDSDEREVDPDEREADSDEREADPDGGEGTDGEREVDSDVDESDRARPDDAEAGNDAGDSGGVLSRVRSILGRDG